MNDKPDNIYQTITAVVLCLTIFTAMLMIVVSFEAKDSDNNYYKALANPPTKQYIEEDLKSVFVCDKVEMVEKKEQDKECVAYLVKVKQYDNASDVVKYDYYLVSYVLVSTKGVRYFEYHWEYHSDRLVCRD